ncbi:MAG: hypothetical protein QF473_37745, partial [Planctomycetota bacterium]|nr:hypothetical protein [Planctomycetota bacterium]
MKVIYGFFEKFFNIRREEFMLVQAFFAYYTCIGMLYTFGPTVGDSLFLSNVAQERIDQLLGWVYVGTAVATVLTTWAYDLIADRFKRIVLLIGMQLVLAVTLFIFRMLLPESGGSEWLYFGLVIWMEVCGLLSISLFFSFAGDYFTSRDAKRLYAYICGGTAVGTVVAGLVTDPIVSVIGTKNLIYICMAMLVSGAGLSAFIYKSGSPVGGEEEEEDESKTPVSAILS